MTVQRLTSEELRARAIEQFPFLKDKSWDWKKYNGQDVFVIYSYFPPHHYIAQSVHIFDLQGKFLGEGWC